MAGLKLLLDTNVLIALEDPKPLPPATAALSQKAQLHGLTLYVDEAAIRDVERDPVAERREITLSKLKRFPTLEGVAHAPEEVLEAQFGRIKNENDRCDVLMLDTLHLGVVDFLVTQDVELHKRAARCGLEDRVFRVVDALAWIRRTYERQEFRLPYVLAKKAHQISLTDPIFASLREDYSGFDDWFEQKCRRQHRDCWIVEIGQQLAGLIIRKDETPTDEKAGHASKRVLKICTFKISPDFRGEKLGEHLLKKVLWFAQANRYDLVYLTAFPKHDFLIALLQSFGFEVARTAENGELVLERRMHHETDIQVPESSSPLQIDQSVYPRYYNGSKVGKFVVPIRQEYHIVLFPEISEATPLPLFPDDVFVSEANAGSDRTPGNTIRKVYVCRSPTRLLKPGDVLLFYLSKAADLNRSQSATSVGIVEQTQLASSLNDLMRCVGRRSVYSREALTAMSLKGTSPVLVIDFLLIGHLAPAVSLESLVANGVCTRPPQSIASIDEAAFQRLKPVLEVSFA